MRRRWLRFVVVGASVAIAVAMGFVRLSPGAPASADTASATLDGEGGSFLSPVTNLLLNSDATSLENLGLYASYNDANIDNAISDFVGTAPGQFSADFAVSERPLTSAESSQAASDGRSFAYVPFASTPVAIAALVLCTPADFTTDVLNSTTFCQNMPLTPLLLAQIFTASYIPSTSSGSTDLPIPLTGWSDSRLTTSGGTAIPDVAGIGEAFALGPGEENYALMSLIDSDTQARAVFDNVLDNPANTPTTTSDTPSEIWPLHSAHAYAGGDAELIEKELNIDPETNAPSELNSWGGLQGSDDAFPVSSVWTGSPLGTPWDVPTAAIENTSGKFVGPSEAAAAAAEADATMDPSTNLVTFKASASDSAAYNSDLMAESYLVVPLTSLAPSKALALAQFVRFVLGGTGQADIKLLGAAPATPSMVTAGLQVAGELDSEAEAQATPTTTATTVASGAATPTTVASSTAGSVPTTTIAAAKKTSSLAKKGSTTPAATVHDVAPGDSIATRATSATSPQLAFTGFNPEPLVVIGISLVACSEVARRRSRRAAALNGNSRVSPHGRR
jgi:ABC-type phosphate transport system substrate-binding protein